MWDMISNTGTFSELFHLTWVDPAETDRNVIISLLLPVGGGPSTQVGISVSCPADRQRYVYCWWGSNPAHTSYFEFSKKRDGLYIDAAGTASDHRTGAARTWNI